MQDDKLDKLGPILNEIGQELAEIAGVRDGMYLYVEAGDGWTAPSVFKEDGSVIRYLDSDGTELPDLLDDAWNAEPEGKRWSVMEYVIENGRFAVSFKYPEEVNVDTMEHDHRQDALRRRYGNKPVVYPPMPEGGFELKN